MKTANTATTFGDEVGEGVALLLSDKNEGNTGIRNKEFGIRNEEGKTEV